MVDPGRVALLMYDPLAEVLTDDICATVPGLVERWGRLLLSACAANVTVVYTQHVFDWETMTGPWLQYLSAIRDLATLGSLPFVSGRSLKPDPRLFHETLRPLDGEPILIKGFNDAFTGTRLLEILRSRNVESLIVTGVATEQGITGTARRAPSLGFYPVVIADCVSSARAQLHEDALRYLRTAFNVVRAEEVIACWVRSVGANKAESGPNSVVAGPGST